MEPLQGGVSTDVLSVEISNDTDQPTGLLYANPEYPYSFVQSLVPNNGTQGGGAAAGMGGQQIVIYNDHLAALKLLSSLNIKAVDTP